MTLKIPFVSWSLERLRWSYLQPELQLLRSNLDRLKSTLLLMLNHICEAGSGKVRIFCNVKTYLDKPQL